MLRRDYQDPATATAGQKATLAYQRLQDLQRRAAAGDPTVTDDQLAAARRQVVTLLSRQADR